MCHCYGPQLLKVFHARLHHVGHWWPIARVKNNSSGDLLHDTAIGIKLLHSCLVLCPNCRPVVRFDRIRLIDLRKLTRDYIFVVPRLVFTFMQIELLELAIRGTGFQFCDSSSRSPAEHVTFRVRYDSLELNGCRWMRWAMQQCITRIRININ